MMNDMSFGQPLSRASSPNTDEFLAEYRREKAFRFSFQEPVQLSIVVPCYNEEERLPDNESEVAVAAASEGA